MVGSHHVEAGKQAASDAGRRPQALTGTEGLLSAFGDDYISPRDLTLRAIPPLRCTAGIGTAHALLQRVPSRNSGMTIRPTDPKPYP